MKKSLFLLLLLAVASRSFAQPSITNLSFPSSVNLFDKYEISFNLGPYGNPYDPDTISVYAIFTAPDNTCDSVLGFYYEGYNFTMHLDGYEVASPNSSENGWRIRFTPDAVGTWSFRIHAIDVHGAVVKPNMNSQPYSFTCQSVANAKGFISVANARYLKRDVVERSQRRFRSFFPVGPNIGWYFCLNDQWDKPIGIYDYERRIDSLYGNANFMRVFLNNYQYLNLYGPEYTQTVNGNPVVYFDSTLNQKDAAELDHIVEYAAQNDISLTLCFLNHSDFLYSPSYSADPNYWTNNPYNDIIRHPYDIFTDLRAMKITRNLFRYIVSRWGYATNIMCWELWNEVTKIDDEHRDEYQEEILIWHKIMADYVREIDPFHHCVSTSMTEFDKYSDLYLSVFHHLDFVQRHHYQSIHNTESSKQMSYALYFEPYVAHKYHYSNKPYFMEEFALSPAEACCRKDPYGIDLHNDLWSSLFSASIGPGSYWRWRYVDTAQLYCRFEPILYFCQSMPLLSGSFNAFTTGNKDTLDNLVFPNNIETYFIKTAPRTPSTAGVRTPPSATPHCDGLPIAHTLI